MDRTAAAQGAAEVRVNWRGRGSIWGLILRNLGLNIVTLGFYRFWARTRLRQYLWSNVEVMGDPLVYTGTGRQLFKGFLLGVAILALTILLFVVLDLITGGHSNGLAFAGGFLSVLAVISSRRYRLGHTQWRGIRFDQRMSGTPLEQMGVRGLAAKFMTRKRRERLEREAADPQPGLLLRLKKDGAIAARLIMFSLVPAVTLGLGYPWYRMRRWRLLMGATWFGNQQFEVEQRGSNWVDWFFALVLLVPTLGLSFVWYRVQEFRYHVSLLSLSGVRARSDLRWFPVCLRVLLAGIIIAAILLVLLLVLGAAAKITGTTRSSGMTSYYLVIGGFLLATLVYQLLAWPILYLPIVRLTCNSLVIDNPGRLEEVLQSAINAPDSGEGLADAFDADIG
jgi:uncharacterized membrane protein YjgN (DUF898 family)